MNKGKESYISFDGTWLGDVVFTPILFDKNIYNKIESKELTKMSSFEKHRYVGSILLEEIKAAPDGAFIFPAIIIIAGLWIIMPRAKSDKKSNMDLKDIIDHVSIFSSKDMINNSTDFKGGNLFAAYGGIDVDLTHADMMSNEPVVVDVFVAFGGISIKVLADWRVEYHGISLFGGADDKTEPNVRNSNKVVIVKGLVLFGGVDISS